ncbi:MAG: LysR family transcriptional regulator [Ruminococcaceae bacterium]|nr:LysR family transcriptional regulator [Oscillospiraceae bacterium]
MTLRHLKMFVAVCESGSVTRASEQLYIAQPTVSHAISELEKYYNVKLFDRINQRLILTDTGRELLVTAKEILSGFESFERLASFGGQSPRVRIGASLTLGQTVVPPYLKRLGAEHPEIEAQLMIKTSASIQAEIENGNLDFAIVEGEVASPYLRAELLMRDRLVAVANAADKVPDTLSAEALAHYPLLLRDHGSASRAFLEKLLTAKGIHIVPRMESVNDQALITAVYASLGIALLPESFVGGHIARGKFKEIKIEDLDSRRNNYLIIHKNRRLNSFQETAYSLMKEM